MSIGSVNEQADGSNLTGDDVPDPVSQVALASSAGAGMVGYLSEGADAQLLSVDAILRLQPLTPELFGAAGDGMKDDYAAFQRLATYANTVGKNVSIQFGSKKTYYLDQYVVTGNGISDVTFTNIHGLVIDFNSSSIKVKGDFCRDIASTRSICGLKIILCTNVVIQDGEIDGSVYCTTRTPNLAESPSHGLSFAGGARIQVRNMFCHHFSCDGIYITGSGNFPGPYVNIQDVALEDCTFSNNGRQGLSLAMGSQFNAVRCKFLNSAFTGPGFGQTVGAYGGHSPRAGVDVEPDVLDPNIVLPPLGGANFEQCVFAGNQNYQFLVAATERYPNITLSDCLIDARSDDGSYLNGQYNFWPGSVNAKIIRCRIYANVNIPSLNSRTESADLLFYQCKFYAGSKVAAENRAFGITSPSAVYTIDSCDFIWRGDLLLSPAGTSGWPNVTTGPSSSPTRFINNRIVVPGQAHPKAYDPTAPAAFPAARFQNIRGRGNSFVVRTTGDTGWAANTPFALGTIVQSGSNFYIAENYGVSAATAPSHTSGSAMNGTISFRYLPPLPPDAFFYTLYSSSSVDGDEYPTDGAFRANSAFPATGPYVFNLGNEKSSQSFKLNTSAGVVSSGITSGSAVPTSGNYLRGHVIFNTGASPAGKVGWICTTPGIAGSTAVFKAFGTIDT